jgi:hypothetical protein
LYATHLEQVDRFLSRRDCFTTLDVPYATVVAEPRAQADRINAFLGGGLDVAQMAAVANRALYRNRREQGDRARGSGG